jgi:hypothetical protein
MAVSETIRLDIGALGLDGLPGGRFTAAERERIADAFTHELSRLLRVHGLPDTGDAAPHIVASLPALPPTASPYRIGQVLARAVHTGLSDQRPASRPRRVHPAIMLPATAHPAPASGQEGVRDE